MATIQPANAAADDARFAASVRELREGKGWSQAELAANLREVGWPNIHPTTVARIEAGTRAVRLGEARAIATLLGSDVSSMVSPTAVTTPLLTARNAANRAEVAAFRVTEAVQRLLAAEDDLHHALENVRAAMDAESLSDSDRSSLAAALEQILSRQIALDLAIEAGKTLHQRSLEDTDENR